MILLFRGEGFDADFYRHAGVDIDNAFLLEDGGKKTLLVHKMNAALAKAEFHGKVVVYGDAIAELRKRLRRRTVLCNPFSMSAHLAKRLGSFCRLKDFSDELGRMRIAKKDEEVRLTAKAVKATKEIFDSLDFKAARTELDLQRQLLVLTAEMGLEPAFAPIVSTDRNTAFPHSTPSGKRLGSLVMVDYGVRYKHYCADLTRCFVLDGDRKKKERYERLRDICWFIADSLPNMGKGKEVASLASDLMKDAGFPKMIHSIGHGVGLEVHERPRLGPSSDDSLKGATIAIEPAFYLSNYGMRYEETIFNDGKKARIL